MNANRVPYQLHMLTLRLWREVCGEEQFEWRGEVKNIKTGEIRYFRDWQVLARLLPELLEEAENPEATDDAQRQEP